MAVSLLALEVSDLCLGKPALRSLPATARISDALEILKNSDETSVSIWNCNHKPSYAAAAAAPTADDCRCIGKISITDVICYLSKEENLKSPTAALKAPVSVLLPEIPGLVIHVEPSCRLLEAVDFILNGAQNLVIPIKTRLSRRKHLQKPSAATAASAVHGGWEYCWLTQEDIIRFLLSSIGLFSPLPALSIESLGIITSDVIKIEYHSPAAAVVPAISRSIAYQTSVAVVDSDGTLIGEISPQTLACCDETVAAALTTLSAGDLMAYIDCGGPPEDLVRVVTSRLRERKLNEMSNHYTTLLTSATFSSSSEDEEFGSARVLPLARTRSGRCSRSMSYSSRMVRRAEAIVCHPKSSLVAVMIQAIAHRVNYVWVIEEDCSLVGIVTFSDMLRVFREHLGANVMG